MKSKKQTVVKKSPRRLSDEQKDEIFGFYLANPNWGLNDIAERFETNMTTVSRLISKYLKNKRDEKNNDTNG